MDAAGEAPVDKARNATEPWNAESLSATFARNRIDDFGMTADFADGRGYGG